LHNATSYQSLIRKWHCTLQWLPKILT